MNKHPLSLILFIIGLLTIILFVGFLAQDPQSFMPTTMEASVSGSSPGDESETRSKDEEDLILSQEVIENLIADGDFSARQQLWQEALASYGEANKIAPNNRQAALGMGQLLSVIGEAEQAIPKFERALELSMNTQDKVEVLNYYGKFLKAHRRKSEAITQFEALLALQPNHGYAAFHLGDLYRSQGRFEEALTYYVAALNAMPGHAPSRMGRSFCLIRLHRYAEARDRLEQDRRLFPQELTFRHALARIMAAAPMKSLRDGPQALAILNNILGHIDIYPQLAESLAMALAEVGNFRRAESIQATAIAKVGLDYPKERVDQMESLRKLYAAGKPCRQPWYDDDPIFYRDSYEPEQVTEYNRSNLSWKAPNLPMTSRLKQIAQQADSSQIIYLNRDRAQNLQSQLDTINELEPFLSLQPLLAKELLRAGNSMDARLALEKIETVLERNGHKLDKDDQLNYLHALAMTNFRLGEQENCQASHNPDSCILPISGHGVHQIERGSRAAIEHYTKILELDPNDLKAQWFLNLAYMTLGEFPDKVPKEYLIDASVFESDIAFPRFVDTATDIGLDLHSMAGGVIADDFDNDGLLDLFISQWGLNDQIRYFRNNGAGGFEELTESAQLLGITGGLNIMQTDYDNNGFLDVFILRGAWLGEAGEHPNSLLRNNGDGTFTDVTEKAGLLSFRPTQTATWLDYNNDGHIDLFVGNETSKTIYPAELYQNNGNGTFREVAREAGIADLGHIKAVASGDFDNDGRVDIFLSRYGQENKLYRNLGPNPTGDRTIWRFEDVTRKAGVGEPLHSFPAWFFDYDNDGHLDLFVSDYSNFQFQSVISDFLGQDVPGERARLFRNRGDGTFEDTSDKARLSHPFVTMGSNFGDLDNDGFLDFYLGTGTPMMNMVVPNRLFHNQGGKTFADVTFSSGLGHLQKGHGISFADLDNDGDQDIYTVMGGAFEGDGYPNAFFQNPGFGNDWIKIKLRGEASNRAGIGARLAIKVRNGNGDPRTIFKTVNSGGSFGANPLRAELGLGKDATVEALSVLWPASGHTQTFHDLRANRAYLITENQEEVTPIQLPKITLGDGESMDHHHPPE